MREQYAFRPRFFGRFLVWALSTMLFLLCANLTYAQVSPTGTLTGTVLDPSGASIPGATVTVTGVATGTVVKATSGSDGRFVLATMTPGEYTVSVTRDGF